MNIVPILLAGGGAFLLFKGASMTGQPPAAGPNGQVPINPAGEGNVPVEPIPGTTETGGSNGAPPEGSCVTCAPADAGLAPTPIEEAPVSGGGSSSSSGSTSVVAPSPTQIAPTTSGSTSGAYAPVTSKTAYIEYKISGYNGLA